MKQIYYNFREATISDSSIQKDGGIFKAQRNENLFAKLEKIYIE